MLTMDSLSSDLHSKVIGAQRRNAKNNHHTVYVVHLVVILIWRFGDFGFDRQI